MPISISRVASRTMLTAGAALSALLPIAGSMALAQTTTTTTTTSQSTTYGYGYQTAPQGGDYRQPAPPPQAYQDPNGPPPQGYQDPNAPPPGYNGQGYGDQGNYPPPPPEPQAPTGYNGSAPPPPPPGYVPQGNPNQWADADYRYAQGAQQWARDNCVKAHGNPAAGAVIGGILGAVIGGSVAGRHSGGAGILVGGALGAGAGAVVAGSADSNATSPGCPPGFVVRRDAYAWGAPVPSGYYYAAPGWYQPWVFVGGNWTYRPYPYHDWYWRTYRGPGWHGGYRGGPGWHGGPRRGW